MHFSNPIKAKALAVKRLLACMAIILSFTAQSAYAGSVSVPIYIAGKQFNNYTLNTLSGTPYSNGVAMNYNATTDCYWFTFTAGTDNSFSLSTQLGNYSTWDNNGICIDRVIYGLSGFSSPVDGYYFEVGKTYLLQHDKYKEQARAASDLTSGQQYTIYIHGDFVADRAGGCDTYYNQTLVVHPGAFDSSLARQPLYITGTAVGNGNDKTNSDQNYTSAKAKKMEYDGLYNEYSYDFFISNAANNTYSLSRLAPDVNSNLPSKLPERYGTWNVKIYDWQGNEGVPPSTTTYYYLWDHNGVYVKKEDRNGSENSSNYNYVGKTYYLTRDFEGNRRIVDNGGTSLTPGLYRMTVAGDFSTMRVDPIRQLFVSGPLVGVTTNTTTSLGYSRDEAEAFNYDAVKDEYTYSFTYNSSRAATFTMSRTPGTYAEWDKGGIRTDRDVYGTNIALGTVYPLIAEEANRTLTASGAFALTDGQDYTIHVSGDFKNLWVTPNSMPQGPQNVMILGATYGSETPVDGLSTTAPTLMAYDPYADVYYYRATANTGGRFYLYKGSTAEANLLSCPNYLSNFNLPVDSKYNLVNNPSLGSQQFESGNSELTIYVSGDLSKLWAVNTSVPEAQRPLYFSFDTTTGTAVNPQATDKTTVKPDGTLHIALEPSASSMRLRLSDFRGGNEDADGGVGAFVGDALRFSASTLDFDTPVSIVGTNAHTTGAITGRAQALAVSYDYLDVAPHYGSSEIIIDPATRTITLVGDARPSLYLTGSLVGKPFTVNGGERVESYKREDVVAFDYNELSGYFYHTFTAAGNANDRFTISTTPGDTWDIWDHGGYCVSLSDATSSRGLLVGNRYILHAYDTSGNGEAPRYIYNGSDGNYLTAGDTYTIYVNYDYSTILIQPGEYDERAARAQNIYLNGDIAPCGWSYANPLQLAYDPDHDWYFVTIPRNSVTKHSHNKEGDPGNYTTYYFDMSTKKGDSTKWGEGRLSVSTMTSNDPLSCGEYYPLNTIGQGGVQQIRDYHSSTTYTIYVSSDLKKMWIRPDLHIIGWITGGYQFGEGQSTPCTIRPFTYDVENDYYYYYSDGQSYSVFEVSYAFPGTNANSQTNSTYVYDFYDGHLAYIPFVNGVQQIQPDLLPMDKVDNLDNFPDKFPGITPGHYPLTEGQLYFNKGSIFDDANNLKGDMTIRTYSPENIYKVMVSGDLKEIWINEIAVNMPLKPEDFKDKSHYFLVGTRTADWRLLPEWELTPNTDNTALTLKDRFMYDGYFGIARVDSYDDYVHHRYTIFANSDPGQQNYQSTATPIALRSFGPSRCFLYNETDAQYPHDTSNSITWNFYEEEYAGQGGEIDSDTFMRLSTPWRIQNLTVALDGDGNPTSAAFTGTNNYAEINAHRAFSIVGSDVNYEQPYTFNNALGTRDLREMGSAYATNNEKNWANSWISYAPDGTPYYDAYGNTLYMTAYDKEWLDNHDVFFDMQMHDGSFMNYNSENLFFTEANDFTAAELADDPYAWLYDKHSFINGGYVGRKIGNTTIEDNLNPTTNYRYYEQVFNNYDGESTDDYTAYDLDTDVDLLGWRCYVLKDVWLKGDFKIWSGWGGNIKATEGWGSTDTAHRWYFGNFGHDVPDLPYPVVGHDVLTTATLPDASDNPKTLYTAFRDVDGAYFHVAGDISSNGRAGDDVDNPGNALQYFNRIILWYNVNRGIKSHNEMNGIVQFIQESLAPNIKVRRQLDSENNPIANKLTASWNLVDHLGDEEKLNWRAVNYTISRYRYVTTYVDGNPVETEQLYRRFDTEDLPEGTTVADLINNIQNFDDPYSLPAGTYFYRITVTVEDSEGNFRSKTATSNTISVSVASKPVIADAIQQMVNDNGTPLYTFNVELTPAFSPNNTALDVTSHYTYAVWEDMEHLVITVDSDTYERLSRASSVEIANPDEIIITASEFKFTRKYSTTFGPVGWTLNSAYADANGKPKFVPNGDGTYSIKFDLQQWAYRASDNVKAHYFLSADEMRRDLQLPRIVWHNVRPTENVVNIVDGIQTPFSPYNFLVQSFPADEYVSNWADAGLVADDAQTHVYAPATYITLSDLGMRKSANTYTGTPEALMPGGAVHPTQGALNPVDYRYVNEFSGHITTTAIPLAPEVLDYIDLDLNVAVKSSGVTYTSRSTKKLDTENGYTATAFSGDVNALPVMEVPEGYAENGFDQPLSLPRRITFTPGVYVTYTSPSTGLSLSTIQRNALPQGIGTDIMQKPGFEFATRHSQRDLFLGQYVVNNQYHGRGVAAFTATSGINGNLHYYYSASIPVDPNLTPSDEAGMAALGGRPFDAASNNWTWNFMDAIDGYTNWTSGEYDHDTHNWSWLAAQNNYIAIHFEPIFINDTYFPDEEYVNLPEMAATCYVTYPFVSSASNNLMLTPDSGATRMSAPAENAPKALNETGLTLLPFQVSSTVPITFNGGDNITTYAPVIGADSGDVRYYNLQGIPVAHPEPGNVYIAVSGSQVTKVYVK